jgi:hypothetical protein
MHHVEHVLTGQHVTQKKNRGQCIISPDFSEPGLVISTGWLRIPGPASLGYKAGR